MCKETKDQATNSVKSAASNLNAKDSHSVDFRIHTNIEFITDKRIKICLFVNVLFTVISLTTSFIIIYKLYTELLQVQNDIKNLHVRFDSLSQSYEQMKYKVDEENASTNSARAEPQIMQEHGYQITDGNYELITHSRDNILTRLRRANGRTKEKTTRRKVKSSGALAAHFKGSIPEIFDEGIVGPWYLDNLASKQYKLAKFHLTEGQCSIEVTEPALYFIYAQVYYITSDPLNSYSVYVRSEGSSENILIAKCSTMGPKNYHRTEISCFTATVYSLRTNDRVFIQQIERNRTIILRDGHSFFGLVRLNNSRRNK